MTHDAYAMSVERLAHHFRPPPSVSGPAARAPAVGCVALIHRYIAAQQPLLVTNACPLKEPRFLPFSDSPVITSQRRHYRSRRPTANHAG